MNSRKILLTAGVLGILFLSTGCVSEAAANVKNAGQLRVGMTKAQVLKIMGEPVKEEFSTPDRWFYFVNPVWADGLTTEEECMPLIFEKGRLVGWGNRFYAGYRSANSKTEGNSEK